MTTEINSYPSQSHIPTPYLSLNILRFVTWEKYTRPLSIKHLRTGGKNFISRTTRKHVIHEICEYDGENAYKRGYLLDVGIKIVGLTKNSCKYYAVLNAELGEEDKLWITALKTNTLVEVKLTENCEIINIPLYRSSATVHTYTVLHCT